MKKFNQGCRVKIPTILHLMRLGYRYIFLRGQEWGLGINIFLELFSSVIGQINLGIEADNISRLLKGELRDWLLPMLMNGQVTAK